MAGYKSSLCPNANVWNIPIFRPQQFPQTPAEVNGITHSPVNYLPSNMDNIQNPIILAEKNMNSYYKDPDTFKNGQATGDADDDIIGAFAFVIVGLAILATIFTLLFRDPKLFNPDE